MNIPALLNAGVRILDVRLALDDDGKIRVSHGVPFACTFVEDVLRDGVIEGFLEKQNNNANGHELFDPFDESEFVVILLRQDFDRRRDDFWPALVSDLERLFANPRYARRLLRSTSSYEA